MHVPSNILLDSKRESMKSSVVTDSNLRKVKNRAILRRYLDLPKFVELLRTRTIYLTRTDLLSDKFEGSLTPSIHRSINEAHSAGIISLSADEFIKKSRENTYINCWTLSAIDNMALWQIYSNTSTGIAITTTKEKLIQECLNFASNIHIELLKVQYINHFNNPDMVISSYTDPLRFKHKAYGYEKEIRVVVDVSIKKPPDSEQSGGIEIPVNINNLIRSVVICPEAKDWFCEQIHDLAKRYKLNVPIRKSKLTYMPK